MNKLGLLLVAISLTFGAYAQGEMDALIYNRQDLSGTARSLSMGGAFGALGGDASVMGINPAGLAIYRSSELSFTTSYNLSNVKGVWNNFETKKDKSVLNIDNLAYIGYFPAGGNSVFNWNVGFRYNRIANFNRNFAYSGMPNQSIADYFADITYGVKERDLQLVKDSYDPYFDNPNLSWKSILAYEGLLIEAFNDNDKEYHSSFLAPDNSGGWKSMIPANTAVSVSERGGISRYDFSGAMNIQDFFMLGASFIVTDLKYKRDAVHFEDFGTQDYIEVKNYLKTEGSGFSFNIGAIGRIGDVIRLGVAYQTPTWYNMEDRFFASTKSHYSSSESNPDAFSSTPGDDPYTEYRFISPGYVTFSAAGIFGRMALLSIDYELKQYNKTKLEDKDGRSFADDNTLIENHFKNISTIRVGGEIRLTPQFSLRAGGTYTASPVKEKGLENGTTKVYTSGTDPQYVVPGKITNYTFGFGYRFTPELYLDVAGVVTNLTQKAYPYPSTFLPNNEFMIESNPINLTENRVKIAFTLGYKF